MIPQEQRLAISKAMDMELSRISANLAPMGNSPFAQFLTAMASMREGKIGHVDVNPILKAWDDGEMAIANARAAEFRKAPHVGTQFKTTSELVKKHPALAKAAELDVGSLTNWAQVTGGQAFGNFSLDPQMARGTIKPDSFTLYQCLNKSAANQIIDFWGYASAIGGSPVGSAFAAYSSVGSGALTTSAGSYDIGQTTLKLLVDGRAITMALSAQNSYANVAEMETANAGLTILSSVNWGMYWGNPTLYANQFQGIYGLIPSRNITDFQNYYSSFSGTLTPEQALFNLIYEKASSITTFQLFGKTTHAFMDPGVIGNLQSLTTTQLTNWLNASIGDAEAPIKINGNIVGMNTRFGPVQFPLDILITARDVPLNGQLNPDTTNQASSAINAPTSVTAAVNSAAAGSEFTSAYAGSYMYAVAACDSSMNESALTFTASVTGVAAGDGVTLTITPNGASQVAYRIFRSGLGYTGQADPTGVSPDPQQFRFIGEVVANGSTAVTWQDKNTHLPGSSTVFLLDLAEEDLALDFRFSLPLSKIDLFAANLFMPWAVAMIGAPRIRVPKWHSAVTNFLPTNPLWNPLVAVNPVVLASQL